MIIAENQREHDDTEDKSVRKLIRKPSDRKLMATNSAIHLRRPLAPEMSSRDTKQMSFSTNLSNSYVKSSQKKKEKSFFEKTPLSNLAIVFTVGVLLVLVMRTISI